MCERVLCGSFKHGCEMLDDSTICTLNDGPRAYHVQKGGAYTICERVMCETFDHWCDTLDGATMCEGVQTSRHKQRQAACMLHSTLAVHEDTYNRVGCVKGLKAGVRGFEGFREALIN
jgi:hypothetical protein